MTKFGTLMAVVAGILLIQGQGAGGSECGFAVPNYCSMFPPCQPCPPCFSLCATLDKPSQTNILIDPNQDIPFRLAVTSRENCEWGYTNAEYQFSLYDECGCPVPCGLTYNEPCRTIRVLPNTSVLDYPKGLRVVKYQLGKTYTVVVGLRGQVSWFRITPFLEYARAAGQVQQTSMTLSLPANARLKVNDEELTVKSTTPRYTVALRPGRAYTYHFECTFVERSKVQTVTRRVQVRAGDELRVDLRGSQSKPATENSRPEADKAESLNLTASLDGFGPTKVDKPATGRISSVNGYKEPVTIILNGNRFRLAPGQSQVLGVEPPGTFTYEVVGIQPPVRRQLSANETFTITVR